MGPLYRCSHLCCFLVLINQMDVSWNLKTSKEGGIINIESNICMLSREKNPKHYKYHSTFHENEKSSFSRTNSFCKTRQVQNRSQDKVEEPSNNDRDSAAHSAGEVWPCLQAPGMEEEGSEENRARPRPQPAGQHLGPASYSSCM